MERRDQSTEFRTNTYECMNCGQRSEARHHPMECSRCGGEMLNIGNSRE
ncbi:rubrerythrin-like domain-containing protein [Natronorarus salvus]